MSNHEDSANMTESLEEKQRPGTSLFDSRIRTVPVDEQGPNKSVSLGRLQPSADVGNYRAVTSMQRSELGLSTGKGGVQLKENMVTHVPVGKDGIMLSLMQSELGVMAVENLLGCNQMDDYFEDIKDAVTKLPQTDFAVSPRFYRIVMAHYFQGQSAEVLLNFCVVSDKANAPAIDVRRLCGDAFLAQQTLEKLKEELIRQGKLKKPVKPQFDSAETSSEDEDDSYFNFQEIAMEELSNNYLTFSRDKPAVVFWLNQMLADTAFMEDCLHTIGMFAFNAEQPENLQVLVEEGGEKLIAVLLKFLPQGPEESCVALARHIAKFAKHCCSSEAFMNKLKETGKQKELLNALFKCIDSWTPKKTNQRNFELTSSRQTKKEATGALNSMKETFPDMEEAIEDFIDQADEAFLNSS